MALPSETLSQTRNLAKDHPSLLSMINMCLQHLVMVDMAKCCQQLIDEHHLLIALIIHFWPTVLSVVPLAQCVICRLSVCLSVTFCIVAKRCVLAKKCLKE